MAYFQLHGDISKYWYTQESIIHIWITFVSFFFLVLTAKYKYLKVNFIFPLRYFNTQMLMRFTGKNWRKSHINLQKCLLLCGSILSLIRMYNSWAGYTAKMNIRKEFWFILCHFQSCLAFILKEHLIKIVSNLGTLIIILIDLLFIDWLRNTINQFYVV